MPWKKLMAGNPKQNFDGIQKDIQKDIEKGNFGRVLTSCFGAQCDNKSDLRSPCTAH